MELWALAVAIKPIAAIAVLVPALMLCRWLYRVLPDSPMKRALFAPLPGHKPRRWD